MPPRLPLYGSAPPQHQPHSSVPSTYDYPGIHPASQPQSYSTNTQSTYGPAYHRGHHPDPAPQVEHDASSRDYTEEYQDEQPSPVDA